MTLERSRYLLLDGAQIDGLPNRLYSLEDNPQIHWLYQDTAYHALLDLGPALIALPVHSALEQVFIEHWQDKAGLLIESPAAPESLAEHLRSLIHARVSGDVTLLLRYYDPRVITHWLPGLDAGQRDRLMGPVSRIRLPRGPNHEQRWLVRQREQPIQRYAARPWLYLDDRQLQQLNGARLELFDQQLLEHVQRYFPECLAHLNVAQQYAWAASCRESAAAQGYSTAIEVSRWSALVSALGTQFPWEPEHQPYRQILQHHELNPEQRLDALLLELHRHWRSTDKESW